MPKFSIRPYTDADALPVGILIADTYAEFNLSFASDEHLSALLGPFAHAHSSEPDHKLAIIQILRSPMIFVATHNDEIAGVIRGRKERLASLFVSKHYHHQGIGRMLVSHFEKENNKLNAAFIRVASTLYAVDFYKRLDYKKSTGVRSAWSFGGQGLQYQPMKKILNAKT